MEFIANPVSGGINTSPTVAKFIARQAGNPWALFFTDSDGQFTFDATNSTVKIMVYKPVISPVHIKVEGATGTPTEIIGANTLINQWEELTYNFSSVIGNTYNRLVILPDLYARPQDNTIYVDNIQVGRTPLDKFFPPGEITVRLVPETTSPDISAYQTKVRLTNKVYTVIKREFAATDAMSAGETISLKEIIQEGMTELEVDGHLALIARREGHMGVLRMRGWNQEMTYAHVLSGESGSTVSFLDSPHGGSGNTPAMAQGASFRRNERDEPIGIDYGVGINGYVADQFRTPVIGNLPDELKRAHDFSLEIHSLFIKEAEPGISCADLYHLAMKRVQETGLKEYFNGYGEGKVRFIGHGLGLEIDEYPILTPRFNQRLEPGMVVTRLVI